MYCEAAYQPYHSASPPYQPPPYPISRYEAELEWEYGRQEIRDYIETLPDDSYERTRLLDDEAFYKAFPEARQAAIEQWIAYQFPGATWAQSPATYYEYAQPSIDYDCPAPPYTSYSIHPPTPAVDFSTFTLVHALTPHAPLSPSPSPSPRLEEATPLVSRLHYDYSSDDEFDYPKFSSVSTPEREQADFELRVVTPGRQGPASISQTAEPASPSTSLVQRAHKLIHPLTPSTARNTTHARPCSPTPPRCSSSSVVRSSPFKQPQFTGDWEADAIAAEEYLYSSASDRVVEKPQSGRPDVNAASTIEHRGPHRSRDHERSPRNRPRPYISTRTSQEPRERSTSPSPRKRTKQLRDKDGKPIMACLFCRGRKIACGPPPMGSDDTHTCNQCARRGLECVYPTENRRGMRRKKSDGATASNAGSSSSSSRKRATETPLLRPEMDETLLTIDDSDDSGSEWDGDD